MARIYLCDPKINANCNKDMCQKECKMTSELKYAKVLIDPMDGMKAVVYIDLEDDTVDVGVSGIMEQEDGNDN